MYVIDVIVRLKTIHTKATRNQMRFKISTVRGSQNLKSQRLSEQGVTQRSQLSCLLVASAGARGTARAQAMDLNRKMTEPPVKPKKRPGFPA